MTKGTEEPKLKMPLSQSAVQGIVSNGVSELPTQILYISANKKEAEKLRKRIIPTTMMDKFNEPDNF